jgi:alanyl-tRNA synthetase
MSLSERLYYADSHLTEFEAQVTSIASTLDGRAALTLDRTAFYPTGGGQPSDTGYVGAARVVECVEVDEGVVQHIIEGHVPEIGERVAARIDWPRRFDHLQQHTAQHILSQAFVKLFNAETRGFRMMERASEIDITLGAPTAERIADAVKLANSIVWSNKIVRVHNNVTREEAARMNLRKESAREGLLRIIEIEDYDVNACGGTHALRTGEVGLIAVRSWERAKGMTRIEFVAGKRALADYDKANATLRSIAAQFSVGRDEAPIAVTRLSEEHKALTRRINELEVLAARFEANALRAESTRAADNLSIIARVVEANSAEHLKRLAHALVANGQTIALLGMIDKDTARLVFACSREINCDMNTLMREACATLDGRGGGVADFAQGGGRQPEKLAETLEHVAVKLLHHKSSGA